MPTLLRTNLILDTDSYKASHHVQYPSGTDGMFSYLESRGGRYGRTVFFGLQYLLQEYLSTPVTLEDVEEAAAFFAGHGEPFPKEGWLRVVNHHKGYLPLKIRAVPEGTVVPTRNVLVTVESTDPDLFWLPGWIETMMVRLWYPVTVATQSWHIRNLIKGFLDKTSNDPAGELGFKLHDFGSRGVSSRESAGIGGAAHLVNFLGSDTVEGVRFANHYYGSPMAGFSIPAMEHSTVTSWGKTREVESFRNMVRHFGGPGKLVACVSDSYDLWNAIDRLWTEDLLDEVKASGGTVVIRPDSGDPKEVILKCLQVLERKVGMTTNLKGYKVLPSYFRVIQGDGVNEDSIRDILTAMTLEGYSTSNIAFGMGGALLQQVNRDTQRFAYKCSDVTIGGIHVPVWKDPVTDPGKTSKKGRVDLVRRHGAYVTLPVEHPGVEHLPDSVLRTVYLNGQVLHTDTLEAVRARAQADCDTGRL